MRIILGTRAVRTIVMAVVCVLAFGSVTPLGATPSTSEIDEQRARAERARDELEELSALAELRHEEYEQIAAALTSTRADVAENRERVDAATIELADGQTALEARANGIYRSGGVHFFEVMLGTSSFGELLTRIEWFRRVSQSDAVLVSDVRSAKDELESAQQALERREEEQSVLRREAEMKRREVETARARQERYVRELDAEIARLVAEEEDRLRREAEERARRAAEEAARRAAEAAAAAEAASSGSAGNTGTTRSASPNSRTFDPSALGQGNPQAVAVGMQYLGVPYVWGGSTPAGFDCSGLAQYVYREIGISIPRTSREQFRVGGYIPPDRLDLMLPGDLVFFGYGGDPGRVHHVGIFVGGGDYLHAPRSGVPVQVDSLVSRIDRRGDFVGATRP